MASTIDFSLNGSSLTIVRQCRPALVEILQSKFGCEARIEIMEFDRDLSVVHQKGPAVDIDQRFSTTLPAGVQVSVCKGDLTKFDADAVVNAANTSLQHYGGLALALSKAGGPIIQNDSYNYTRQHGDLKTGEAIMTNAGMLPCRNVIHAVGPQVSMYASHSEVSKAKVYLEKAISSILDLVKNNHLQSVAIPAISSGLFNFPLPLCADTIVSAVKNYYDVSQGHRPKQIFLVNNDEPTVREMERACKEILGSHTSMSYSQTSGSKSKGAAGTATTTVELGKVRLTLKKGNIEQQQTDVIVNTASSDLNLNSGHISKALHEKAGYGMQQEMYDKHKGSRIKDQVISTKSYKLQCKEVYHVLCTKTRDSTSQQMIHSLVKKCLQMAVGKHKSITFPAIGTGNLGIDKDEVAQIMSHAVADFAKTSTKNLEVYFVIFPPDTSIFEAFENQMRYLQRQTVSHLSDSRSNPGAYGDDANKRPLLKQSAIVPKDLVQDNRASTPQICLIGPSDEATQEAKRWLSDLFKSTGRVKIYNNFLTKFGEQEFVQLCSPNKDGVSITPHVQRGRPIIIVDGDSIKAAVARIQVESTLCKVQRELIKEEQLAIRKLLSRNVDFKRELIDHDTPEFSSRMYKFSYDGLKMLKMEMVTNAALEVLFDHKKQQLSCNSPRRMFQRIPAQCCDMVCHIGFQAEIAPPDDAAYGEGIYFAGGLKAAMEVWKEKNEEYLYFVEADVLTGTSIPGHRDLYLPPYKVGGTDPTLYDSVSGGPDVSVIFSGYQALPKYIITCKNM